MENEKELQNGEAVEETPVSSEENTEAPAEKEAKKKGEKKAKAEQVLEMAKSGEDFDELLEIYGEDPGFAEYTNGYYLTAASEYEIAEVKDVLPEMKTGEIRLVQSDYGFHIVKKYELDEGAYKDKTNADFFTDFNDKLMTDMFLNLVGQYTDKVEVDEELASSIEIRDVAANYYY